MQDASAQAGPPGRDGGGRADRNRSSWLLTIVTLVLMAAVVVVQRPEKADPKEVRAALTGTVVEAPEFSPLIGVAKVRLWAGAQGALFEPLHASLMQAADDFARTAADRFRVAILAGEVGGAAAREKRFEELIPDLDPDSPLHQDIQTVRALKAPGEGIESPPEVTDEAKAALRERHGWFARLVLAPERPGAEAAFEKEIAEDGKALFFFFSLLSLFILGAITVGLVILIIGLVQAVTGRLRARFVPTPAELGSDRGLWLETFAAFLAGFLIIRFARDGLEAWAGKDAAWTGLVALGLQWSLIGLLFWPLFRGMSWERFRGELGWHRGRGFFREVGCGILGYLAGLPIYFGMAFLVFFVNTISQAIQRAGAPSGEKRLPEPPLPDNKVFDMVAGSHGPALLLLASLIVIWAPVVEESIFRGALYRHVRQRLGGWGGLVLSVAIVAAAFALAHAYVLVGVLMVATLGAVFTLMREWRGSLIAPMTAHCLHNSMVLTVLLTVVPLMKG